MKRLAFIVLMAAAALAALSGCKKDDPAAPGIDVSGEWHLQSSDKIDISAEGIDVYVSFLSSGSFEIYQKIFRVRSWKEYIPVIGSFDKKHLSTEIKNDYLTAYLLESLRAELCHAFSLLFGIVICLFTQGRHADFLIMLWLLALNMPCIIIQRYNRPRFERIINRPRPDAPSGMVKFWLMEEPEEISNQGRT